MRISDWSSDVCSSDLASFSRSDAAFIIDLGWHQRALAHAARLASQSSTPTVFSLVIASTPSAIANATMRSEEHTSELQSLMRISYAVFCLKKKIINVIL